MEDTIVYRVALIGGPFDAAPGLHVVAWSEMPPPDRLRVGMCSGRGECQFSPCAGTRHVAYWIPEVEDAPVRAEPYELEGHDEVDAADPVARYVVGGLSMPRRGEQVEMVPAGAAGGVAYG